MSVTADELVAALSGVPTVTIARGELFPAAAVAGAEAGSGMLLVDLAVKSGLAASKAAARRLLSQGGFYVNHKQIHVAAEGDAAAAAAGAGGASAALGPRLCEKEHVLMDKVVLLRSGGKNFKVVVIGE